MVSKSKTIIYTECSEGNTHKEYICDTMTVEICQITNVVKILRITIKRVNIPTNGTFPVHPFQYTRSEELDTSSSFLIHELSVL